jgi:glycosyltransferase involved in cell wall biosynthesis
MKVAIDATPLTVSSGGLTRYTEQVSAALAQEFPEDQYFLMCERAFRSPAGSCSNLLPDVQPDSLVVRRWWTAGLASAMRRRRCDLFHGTNFMVSWLPLRPSVVTVHDLSPWMGLAPDGFIRRRARYQLGWNLATMVITPSEAVRRQFIAEFRWHPDRVVAIPLAASSAFQPVAPRPHAAPYFLFAGNLEPRKNLRTLLEAWRQVRCRHGVDLLLAGRVRDDFNVALKPEPGLHVLGEVPDSELAGLYSGAAAVTYPSLYEGFGLPVLEAMQCGALVLASHDPAIKEVAGNAAILVDTKDVHAWVDAMEAAVAESGRFDEIRRAAIARARLFSWRSTALATHEVYTEALLRWDA